MKGYPCPIRPTRSDAGPQPPRARRRRRRAASPGPTARSLLLTSGKGGVGTSNLALEPGGRAGGVRPAGRADRRRRSGWPTSTCSAAWRSPRPGRRAGRDGRPLAEAIVDGPESDPLPARRPRRPGLATAPSSDGPPPAGRRAGRAPETDADFLLIDAGSGLGPGGSALADAADAGGRRRHAPSRPRWPTPTPSSPGCDADPAAARRSASVVNQARSSAEAIEALDRLASACRAVPRRRRPRRRPRLRPLRPAGADGRPPPPARSCSTPPAARRRAASAGSPAP